MRGTSFADGPTEPQKRFKGEDSASRADLERVEAEPAVPSKDSRQPQEKTQSKVTRTSATQESSQLSKVDLGIRAEHRIAAPSLTEAVFTLSCTTDMTHSAYLRNESDVQGVPGSAARPYLWDLFRDKKILVGPGLYVRYLDYWLHSNDLRTLATRDNAIKFASVLLDRRNSGGTSMTNL